MVQGKDDQKIGWKSRRKINIWNEIVSWLVTLRDLRQFSVDFKAPSYLPKLATSAGEQFVAEQNGLA